MAVAAVALVAAAVITAVGNDGRISAAGGKSSSAESIYSTPDAATLKASPRGRQTHLSSRTDQGAAKSRPILFAAAFVGALLLAVAVAWLSRPASPARTALERRRRSLFLRGPPAPQLALIH